MSEFDWRKAAMGRPGRAADFQDLMLQRVQDILLVSSLYDSFILKEDGRLNELLVGESVEMNLQQIPSITQVSTGAEALARWHPRFNLVVTNLEVGDMNAAQLAREIKADLLLTDDHRARRAAPKLGVQLRSLPCRRAASSGKAALLRRVAFCGRWATLGLVNPCPKKH